VKVNCQHYGSKTFVLIKDLVCFAAAFLTQTICIDETTVKFEIWDTAGQERYHSLAPMYYRGAQAAIIVYDITSQVNLPPVIYISCIHIYIYLFVV